MRANYQDLPPASWSFEEGLHHITGTFDGEAKRCPDIMEPYVVMLAEARDDIERKAIMRQALRETVQKRYGGANDSLR